MKLKVLVHLAEEGGLWAEVPGLLGCISEVADFPETFANIRDAAGGGLPWRRSARWKLSQDKWPKSRCEIRIGEALGSEAGWLAPAQVQVPYLPIPWAVQHDRACDRGKKACNVSELPCGRTAPAAVSRPLRSAVWH